MISNIRINSVAVIFIRMKKKKQMKNCQFEDGILISAKYGKKTVEIQIYDIEPLTNDNGIGKSLFPLFAYNILQTYERPYNII